MAMMVHTSVCIYSFKQGGLSNFFTKRKVLFVWEDLMHC